MAGDEGRDTKAAASRPADDYERKYMAGGGDVLRREKAVWRFHWILLFPPLVFLAVAALGFAGVGTKPMPLAVAIAMLPMSALLFFMWALFITLRVTVTTREIVVQYGLFGPRIPIDRIESCVVKDYPSLNFAGGIKRIDGAWAYTLYGHGTRVVRIEWRDAAGRKRATILASKDPDEFAASVQRARSAQGNVAVRVANGALAQEGAAAAEVEAAAEAEANEDRRAKRG